MLTSLSINNFRGLKGLEIKPLGRINLLAGKNGSGKTSVLEALWIFSAPDMPELTLRVAAFRGLHSITAQTAFVDLFNGFDPHKSIQIGGHVTTGSKARNLTISLEERTSTISRSSPSLNPPDPNMEFSTQLRREGRFNIVFEYAHEDGHSYISRGWWLEQVDSPASSAVVPLEVTTEAIYQNVERVPEKPVAIFLAALHRDNPQTEAQRFGELQLQGKDEEIMGVLHSVEPRLQSIVPIYITNVPEMHANIGEARPVSIRLLGGGFSRLFSISVAMGSAKGGMLLIDEIENGLHHTVLKDIFSNLLTMAKKFDVQVVATTHSAECIDAAFLALGRGDKEDFTYHRIDRLENHSRAVYYDHEMLETAAEFAMEVR